MSCGIRKGEFHGFKGGCRVDLWRLIVVGAFKRLFHCLNLHFLVRLIGYDLAAMVAGFGQIVFLVNYDAALDFLAARLALVKAFHWNTRLTMGRTGQLAPVT